MIDFDGQGHPYGALVDGWPCARLVLVERVKDAQFAATLEDGTTVMVTDDQNTYMRCGRPKEEHA